MLNDEVQHSSGYRVFEGAEENSEVRHLNDGVLEEGEELREDVALHVDLVQLPGS